MGKEERGGGQNNGNYGGSKTLGRQFFVEKGFAAKIMNNKPDFRLKKLGQIGQKRPILTRIESSNDSKNRGCSKKRPMLFEYSQYKIDCKKKTADFRQRNCVFSKKDQKFLNISNEKDKI